MLNVNWDLIPQTTSQALCHLFQGSRKTHLEIDGYNFGKQLWTWIHPNKDVNSLSKADFRYLRADVVALTSCLCNQSVNCTARIVFDGWSCGREIVNERVEVVFSGGDGQDRADIVMLYDFETRPEYSDYDHIVVVTDDHDLGSESIDLGHRLLGAIEFSNLLKRTVSA